MVALHCFWEERERVRSLPLSCIFCSQGCPIERFIPVVVRIAAILNHKKPLPPRLRPSLIYAPFFSFLHSLGQAIPRKFASVFFWTTCRTVLSRSTGVIFFYPFLFPRLSLLTHLLLLLLSSLTCVIYYSSCFTYSLEGGSTVTHSPAPSLHPLKYFHPLL